MAQAYFNHKNSNPDVTALSAGDNPADEIDKNAVKALLTDGIDISDNNDYFPKLLNIEVAKNADAVYTMGCNVSCPNIGREFDDDFDLGDPFSLNGPVGMTGANRRGDVARIENLLGRTGHLDVDRTDGLTGFFGDRVAQAVAKFQKDNGLTPDGEVRPGGETIRTLKGLIAEKSEQPRPAAAGGFSEAGAGGIKFPTEHSPRVRRLAQRLQQIREQGKAPNPGKPSGGDKPGTGGGATSPKRGSRDDPILRLRDALQGPREGDKADAADDLMKRLEELKQDLARQSPDGDESSNIDLPTGEPLPQKTGKRPKGPINTDTKRKIPDEPRRERSRNKDDDDPDKEDDNQEKEKALRDIIEQIIKSRGAQFMLRRLPFLFVNPRNNDPA